MEVRARLQRRRHYRSHARVLRSSVYLTLLPFFLSLSPSANLSLSLSLSLRFNCSIIFCWRRLRFNVLILAFISCLTFASRTPCPAHLMSLSLPESELEPGCRYTHTHTHTHRQSFLYICQFVCAQVSFNSRARSLGAHGVCVS